MSQPVRKIIPRRDQRYRSLIETVPVLVFRMGSDGMVLNADADSGAFLDCPIDHIVGRPFWVEVVHPEDHWKLTEALRRVVEEETRTTVSVRFQMPGQDLRLARLHLIPAVLPATTEIEALAFDVTEQTEVEAGLLQNEAFYRVFLEQSPMGILHLDAAGVVTFENHAFRQIVGEGVEDAWIGRRIGEIPGLEVHLKPLVEQMLVEGTPVLGEAATYRQSDTADPTHLIVHGSSIRRPGVGIVGGVMMIQDVTDQHRRAVELHLHSRYDQAETALREVVLVDLNEIVFLHEAARILGETAQADRVHLLTHLGDDGHCATRAVWVDIDQAEPFSLYVDSGAYPALRTTVVYKEPLHLKGASIPQGAQALYDLTEAEEVMWLPFFDTGRLGGFVLFERMERPPGDAFWPLVERRLMERLVRLFEALWSWIQVGQRYRLTVATIEECLFTFHFGPDTTRHFLFLTPQIKTLTGYDAAELMAAQEDAWSWIEALVHPDDREQVRIHDRALHQGEESRITFRVLHRDGGYRWLAEQASPHHDAAGHVTISGILTDVTDRKEAEEVLVSARAQVASASRLKSTFVSTVSHELRTPLGAVNGFVELLADELTEWEGQTGLTLPPQVHEFAEAIRQNAKRLLMFTDDLFVLSNMEIGALQLEKSAVSLPRIVERKGGVMAERLDDTPVTLELDLDPQTPPVVGDAYRIEQILSTLLSNAAKFTDTGSIIVRTRGVGDEGCVEVADTGIGIGEEYLSKLFTPFLQEDHRLNRRYEGTGLSLALVKRLLDLMGGRIEVESEKGKGSVFRIFLPISH